MNPKSQYSGAIVNISDDGRPLYYLSMRVVEKSGPDFVTTPEVGA